MFLTNGLTGGKTGQETDSRPRRASTQTQSPLEGVTQKEEKEM